MYLKKETLKYNLMRTMLQEGRALLSLEHFPHTIFPRNRFMYIHPLPVPNQWSHLVNLVKQPKESTCVYEEHLSPLPLVWILFHIFQHYISSFPTKYNTKLNPLRKRLKKKISFSKVPRVDKLNPGLRNCYVFLVKFIPVNRVKNNTCCFSNFLYKFKLLRCVDCITLSFSL